MSQLPQDVEEFIAAHEYEYSRASGEVYKLLRSNDLRAWMAGHVRVPVEPTEEMIVAGCKHHDCQQQDPSYSNDELTEYDCTAIYKAMLDASKETV